MAVPWSCVGGEGRLKWQVEAGEGLLRAGGRQWRMATHSSQFQGPVRKGNRCPSFGIGCAGQIGRVVNSSGSIKVATSGVGGAVQENNAADELATCGTLFSCSMFKRCRAVSARNCGPSTRGPSRANAPPSGTPLSLVSHNT